MTDKTPAELAAITYTEADVVALRRLAQDEQHKDAVKWIIEKAGLYLENAFVPGYPDISAYRQGRHDVGVLIVKLMKTPRETPKPSSVSVRKRARKGSVR